MSEAPAQPTAKAVILQLANAAPAVGFLVALLVVHDGVVLELDDLLGGGEAGSGHKQQQGSAHNGLIISSSRRSR